MQAFLKHLANVVSVRQLTWQDFLKVCMRHRNKSWDLKKKKKLFVCVTTEKMFESI